MNQLPKFRGFRATRQELPATTSSYSSVPQTQTAQPKVEKKPGLFSSLVKGVVQPAIDYTKFVGEAALQGGRALLDPEMRKATFNPGSMTEQDWIKLGDKKKTFLLDEKDIKDPLTTAKTGLKRTAGAATYAIPGGVGTKALGKVGSVAASGALTGGLYGLYEGEDIDPRRIFSNAAAGAVVAPLIYGGGQAVSKAKGAVSSKFGGINKKVGQKLLDEADDYAVKSTRINTSNQNKFKKSTGKDISGFIQEKNLYGQDLEKVDEMLKPLYEARKKAIQGGNKVINPQEVIADFNAKIAELQAPGKRGNPVFQQRVKALENARDLFVEDAVAYAESIGDDSLSQYPLQLLDQLRGGIDANTPASQFLANPVEFGNNRTIGGVYRNRVNTTAGTKGVGLEIRNMEAFKDALERAPKGNNVLPFGLNKGVWATVGNTVGNLPFGVGAMVGSAAESVVNNPNNIGRLSRGMKSAGNALVNSKLPQIPGAAAISSATRNTVGRIPGNTARNMGINAVNAGINSMSSQAPDQASITASRQAVVQGLAEQGITDPAMIAQYINEAAQRQGMKGDFTPEEVAQYLRNTGRSGQLPKFRGFSSSMR